MKKILVINGSRNYESKGYKIINKIKNNLSISKYEFILLDPIKLQLEFCLGCKKCFETGSCPLDCKDSGGKLKEMMKEADIIILLSPVYAHNVSGDIKNMIDRLSYWLHLFPLLGKPGIIITTTDSNGHTQVEDYLERMLWLWGINIVYKENFYNTYSQKNIELRIKKIIEKIEEIDFIKTPKFTSYQEAAFQNYKYILSFDKETAEYKYWEKNGLLYANSLYELYQNRFLVRKDTIKYEE